MSNKPMSNQTTIYQRPAELLQQLVRFDTTNPPGNEAECVNYIYELLTGAGYDVNIITRHPARPNLVTRLKGRGEAPPLLLYGHVDVVTTNGQTWRYPPFEGKMVNGYVWGRGALDMKSGLAMMLSALLYSKVSDKVPPGDIIFAAVADEEGTGDYGARYLVENYAALFNGVRYALSEFGGFSLHIGGQRFYPIQVAEKQICWIRAIIRGPGGHGSMPIHGGAMAKLGQFLQLLDQNRLPVHVTPPARQMIQIIADSLSSPSSFMLRQLFNQLLNPKLTDSVINLIGERGQLFDSILHNTINATIVRGGDNVNVIPSEIIVELDGRLLPGHTPDDMLTELHEIVGDIAEFELIRHDPGPTEADMGMFNLLANIIKEADPEGIPIPLLLSGVTDARYFARLGIQTYGFTPLKLPENFNFIQTIHAADERVPIDAVEFGTEAIYRAMHKIRS